MQFPFNKAFAASWLGIDLVLSTVCFVTPTLTRTFNGRHKCLFQRKGGSLEEVGAIFAYCLPIPFPGLQVNMSTEAKIE